MPRSKQHTVVAVASLLVFALAAPSAGATDLSSCDEALFRQAVQAGGTVRFTVDCVNPPVVERGSLIIGPGAGVTIDANAHTLGTGGTAAGLVVRVSCDRAATVVLNGTATITKRARAASAGQRRFAVRSVKVQVVAGKRRSITLRLPTPVREAVSRGDRVSVVLRAAVKTPEGASSTATATVRQLKAAKRAAAR